MVMKNINVIQNILGPIIYHIMFKIASWVSTFIACRSRILYGKKGELVSPSQLDDKWFINRKSPDLKNCKTFICRKN